MPGYLVATSKNADEIMPLCFRQIANKWDLLWVRVMYREGSSKIFLGFLGHQMTIYRREKLY